MSTNLDRYQADLDGLIQRGDDLFHAVQRESRPKEFDAQVKKHLGDKGGAEFIKELPQFNRAYQPWYSEAKSLIRQILPDRLDDFVRHYEKPKSRKATSYENCTIEDALQGLRVTRGYRWWLASNEPGSALSAGDPAAGPPRWLDTPGAGAPLALVP